MTNITYKHNSTESGNVLFLILIAVALFAALSYAVTSSTNSGGGNADNESNLVNSAAVTQYPASIKTAIIRQMVSRSVDNPTSDDDLAADGAGLLFDKPPFEDGSGNEIPTTENYRLVFHPDGGGASYSPASVGLEEGESGEWFFSKNFEVTNIGSTDDGGLAGNEIIAFLPGLTSNICEKINEEVGITGDINSSALTIDSTAENLLYGEEIGDVDTVIDAAGISGKPYGCFLNGGDGGTYVYYHVLLEG